MDPAATINPNEIDWVPFALTHVEYPKGKFKMLKHLVMYCMNVE